MDRHTKGFGEGVGLVIGLVEVLPLHRRSALKCFSGLLTCGGSVHNQGCGCSHTHLLHPERIGSGDELVCGGLVCRRY
jgi:hypothetical protein